MNFISAADIINQFDHKKWNQEDSQNRDFICRGHGGRILPTILLTRKRIFHELNAGNLMLLILPTGMNYRTERLPVVTLTIIGVNTLVYLVSLIFLFVTNGESRVWIEENLWLIPSKSILTSYFTSMFV